MKKLLKLPIVFGGIAAIFLIQIFFYYILPYPFSQINIILLSIILLIMRYESGLVVWFAFPIFFLMDIYSINMFGLNLLAGTNTVLFIFYLYQEVFTNKSWYSAMVLVLLGVFLFRFLYVFLYYAINLIANNGSNVGVVNIQTTIWEVFLTSLLSGIVFLVLNKKLKYLNVELK